MFRPFVIFATDRINTPSKDACMYHDGQDAIGHDHKIERNQKAHEFAVPDKQEKRFKYLE